MMQQPQTPPNLKPLFQARTVTEVAGDAFAFYIRDWQSFIAISAATIPLSFGANLVDTTIERDTPFDEMVVQTFTTLLLLAVVTFGVSIVIGAIAAFLQAGFVPEFGVIDAYRASLQRLADLAIGNLRAGVIVVILAITFIGIPFAIMRMVQWAFIPQVVILEGSKGSDALTRSAFLVHGRWWRTLSRLLFVLLIPVFLTMPLSESLADTSLYLSAFASAMVGAFTFPFVAIGATLIYCDLQVTRPSVGVSIEVEPPSS